MRISDWSSDVCSSDLFGTAVVYNKASRKTRYVYRLPYQKQARLTLHTDDELLSIYPAKPFAYRERYMMSYRIAGLADEWQQMADGQLVSLDRKSTRLNSSH